MSVKTAAEIQLDILKKLKEQKRAVSGKGRVKGGPKAEIAEKRFSLNLVRTAARRRGIPLSESAWRQLKAKGIDNGKFKLNQALGDLAVELLLKMPLDFGALSPEGRDSLFRTISEWFATRGLK